MLAAVFTMAMPKMKKKLEEILFSYEGRASVNEESKGLDDEIQGIKKEENRMTAG